MLRTDGDESRLSQMRKGAMRILTYYKSTPTCAQKENVSGVRGWNAQVSLESGPSLAESPMLVDPDIRG